MKNQMASPYFEQFKSAETDLSVLFSTHFKEHQKQINILSVEEFKKSKSKAGNYTKLKGTFEWPMCFIHYLHQLQPDQLQNFELKNLEDFMIIFIKIQQEKKDKIFYNLIFDVYLKNKEVLVEKIKEYMGLNKLIIDLDQELKKIVLFVVYALKLGKIAPTF